MGKLQEVVLFWSHRFFLCFDSSRKKCQSWHPSKHTWFLDELLENFQFPHVRNRKEKHKQSLPRSIQNNNSQHWQRDVTGHLTSFYCGEGTQMDRFSSRGGVKSIFPIVLSTCQGSLGWHACTLTSTHVQHTYCYTYTNIRWSFRFRVQSLVIGNDKDLVFPF